MPESGKEVTRQAAPTAREQLRERLLAAIDSDREPSPPTGLLPQSSVRSNHDDQFEPFPLLDLQQAYWVGRQRTSTAVGTACHGYLELDVPELDTERLEQACNKLIERHPMLRAIVDGDGVQRVLDTVPRYRPPLTEVTTDTDTLDAIRTEMSHQVLPTDRWPLFDIRVTRMPDGISRVHISFDILIADALSFQILASELVQLYMHPDRVLPPIDVTFRDYVAQVTDESRATARAEAEQYWRTRLDDLPSAPELPLRCPIEAIESPKFTRLEARIEGRQWKAIDQHARAAGVGTAPAILTAMADTIGLWAAAPEFTLNLTVFDRPPLHPHIDRVVGAFTNTTLLAVDLREHRSVRDLAAAVQQQLWSNLEHREFTGVALLREMSRRQESEVSMPIVFTHVRTPDNSDFRNDLAQLGTVRFSISQTPQVLLDCQVIETSDAVSLIWDVVSDAFDEAMLDDMFQTFTRTVGSLADESTWSASHAATTPESVRLTRAGAELDADFRLRPLHELVLAAAAATPEAIAVVDTAAATAVTYRQLSGSALALSAELRALGRTSRHVVGVVGDRGWAAAAAVIGICAAGAAYLPLDPALPDERLAIMADAAGIDTLVVGPDRDRPAWFDGRLVTVREADSDADPAATVQPAVGLDDLAYVIFTSGSTGTPKGVRITHAAAATTLLDINRRFMVGPGDRVLAVSSLGFDLSVWDIFGVLAAGATVVTTGQAEAAQDPSEWLKYSTEHRITLWNSVPALMNLLVDLAQLRDVSLPDLRLVLLSGDWIPLDLPERIRSTAPNARVLSLGGATEAAVWSVVHDTEEPSPGWSSVPYGKPLTNQRTYVLDALGRERPLDVPGELHIGGSGVADGYWNDPALTAEAFPLHAEHGRLYRTGDFVRLRRNGQLEMLYRLDGQVKVRGYRVELGDLDAALTSLPGVRTAISQVIGDREHDRRLVSYVVPADEHVTADALRAALLRIVPAYLVPSHIVFVPEFPLSGNGKVDRRRLRELPLTSTDDATSGAREQLAQVRSTSASSPLGEHLLEWVRLRLDQPGIEADTDLVLVGMDSVHLITLLNEAERRFGLRPSHVELMRAPSVTNFRRLLEVEMVRRFVENEEGRAAQPPAHAGVEEGVV